MMRYNRRIIKAAAGTGKTTTLIEEAVKRYMDEKVLYLTYTNANLDSMKKDLIESVGIIPNNIKCKTWTEFLLNDIVRPYRTVIDGPEIKGINFCKLGEIPRLRGVKADNWKYYYDFHGNLYYERLAQLSYRILNSSSNVIDRLENIYKTVLVDEIQDMVGYDLKILEALYKARVNLIIVGDHRQSTYSTNAGTFLSRYRGINIFNFFKEELNHEEFETLELCHRCPQVVCDLANTLYDDLNLKSAKSNDSLEDRVGAFIVSKDNIVEFIEQYKPTILYYNITALNKFKTILNKDLNFDSISFGRSKGLSFENVLIIPTKEMENHIANGEHKMSHQTLAQFYVAITRSKNSIGILSDKPPYFECLTSWQDTTKNLEVGTVT